MVIARGPAAALLAAGLLAGGLRAQEPGPAPTDWRYPLHPPVVTARHAMVVSDAPLATAVGVQVLRAGGNAIDAAIATAFALAVVYPEAGNLGGGGFIVARLPGSRRAALDFREQAPAAATPDMYLDSLGQLTNGSVIGWRASGVPGTVMGLWQAHRRFGRRPWASLLAPAIRLAERGFPVDAELHGSLARAQARLAPFPATAALLYPGGQVPATGSRMRNPELARTLRRIAREGAKGFYQGETADLITRAMAANGGLVTRADLRAYRAVWRQAVEFTYRGRKVISMPPPSSGGLTLALIAHILQGYDLRALGWASPEALHLTAEAMRRAFAERNAFLGDPDFASIPRDHFLSDTYAARIRATIDSLHASPSAAVRAGAPALSGTHTTHLGVVDARGGAVALTTTINDLYGSGVTIAGAGFLMNDEMDDFTTRPGSPNMYGLVQGVANAIAHGKRPLSAMTPVIVLDPAGRPLLVTGARGGPRIISAVYQVLSNVLDFGMDVGSAVAAPRIHQQHLPDTLYFEPGGFSPALLDSLRARGQTPVPMGGIGSAPSILRRGHLWTAYPDPRSSGAAQGY